MGLLDSLSSLSPEQTEGLLGFASQMLQASGPSTRPVSFGQALGAGLDGYQHASELVRRRKLQEQEAAQMARMRDLQIRGAETDFRNQELRQQQEASIAAELASRRGGAPAQAEPQFMASAAPGVGPLSPKTGGPDWLQAHQQQNGLEVRQPQLAGGKQNRTQALIERLSEEAEVRAMYNDFAGANERLKAVASFMPEVSRIETALDPATQKPVRVITYKNGTEEVSAYGAKPEMVEMNLGGTTQWVDKNQVSNGQSFKRTMSPGEAAANKLGWANFGLSSERLSMDKQAQGPGGGKAPAGYRWAADGSLEAIPGGPATKGATATEGERKAATLLQRLQFSEGQLAQALKEDPDAATPNLFAQGLRGIGAEAGANFATSEARQRVDTAQLDILDAALTLGTGAAYTKEQLEGYRKSYFPQIGDSEGTVKDKRARLNNLIGAAKLAAGRAAPASSGPPMDIPQGAVNMLRMNPKLRDHFDAKYGAGAAASVLGQ